MSIILTHLGKYNQILSEGRDFKSLCDEKPRHVKSLSLDKYMPSAALAMTLTRDCLCEIEIKETAAMIFVQVQGLFVYVVVKHP